MLPALLTFLNRPLSEDFHFRRQVWSSAQGGVYVFLFLYLFVNTRLPVAIHRPVMLALFGAGCFVATLFANWVVPRLLPVWYDEDRWTVGRHALHVLFILLCISVSNQLLLTILHLERPAFYQMYILVTLIGFFPITVNVLLAEQRRLKRNLAQAQTVNRQIAHEATVVPASVPVDAPVTLTAENGRDQLRLPPDQLRYIESVGNYVDVHWLDGDQSQKTVLRSTLKDIEATLADHPQFFRCHRAFIVNLNAVRHTEGNARGYQLTLTGTETRIPVSRSYLDAFDSRIAAVR